MTRGLVPLLAAAAFAVAGCGGSTHSSSGSAGGTVTTTPSSTTAGASFDVNFKRVRQQLASGLKQVQSSNTVSAITGGGAALTNCTDTVTSQLGTRAKTERQKQAVSQLRTACADAANAMAKLKGGDTAAAKQLAKTAAQEVANANP